jgi:hypothetical protein
MQLAFDAHCMNKKKAVCIAGRKVCIQYTKPKKLSRKNARKFNNRRWKGMEAKGIPDR